MQQTVSFCSFLSIGILHQGNEDNEEVSNELEIFFVCDLCVLLFKIRRETDFRFSAGARSQLHFTNAL
jgi:hypothetical protein